MRTFGCASGGGALRAVDFFSGSLASTSVVYPEKLRIELTFCL